MIVDMPPLSLAEIMAGVSLVGTVVALLRKPIDRASADLAELEETVSGTATKKELEALETRVREIERQQIEIESDLSHLPDRDTAHRMEMAIARLEGRLETMDERLKPVAAIGDRLQEFLLDQVRVKP